MGLEIAEQLGWRLPDVIVYPTGGGVGIIGIYKALLELRELGWVDGELPRLVAVQADRLRADRARRSSAGAADSEPWPDARTVAFGITVPKALGDFLVLDALYADRRDRGRGRATTNCWRTSARSRRLEGAFICPEGAACFTRGPRGCASPAGCGRARRSSCSTPGTGLKYPETMPVAAQGWSPTAGACPV